jgi:hypothetical protein
MYPMTAKYTATTLALRHFFQGEENILFQK